MNEWEKRTVRKGKRWMGEVRGKRKAAGKRSSWYK